MEQEEAMEDMLETISSIFEIVHAENINAKDIVKRLNQNKLSYKNYTVESCMQIMLNSHMLNNSRGVLDVGYSVEVEFLRSIIDRYEDFLICQGSGQLQITESEDQEETKQLFKNPEKSKKSDKSSDQEKILIDDDFNFKKKAEQKAFRNITIEKSEKREVQPSVVKPCVIEKVGVIEKPPSVVKLCVIEKVGVIEKPPSVEKQCDHEEPRLTRWQKFLCRFRSDEKK